MLSLVSMPSTPKIKKQPGLEAWQLEDARRLKAFFETRSKLSQEEFGATYGIGSQGMVWQYLNARRPLNPKAAKGFANGLDLSLGDISPTIKAQLEQIVIHAGGGAKPAELMEKCLDMNASEWIQMLEFADFLRSKRRAK